MFYQQNANKKDNCTLSELLPLDMVKSTDISYRLEFTETQNLEMDYINSIIDMEEQGRRFEYQAVIDAGTGLDWDYQEVA